MRINLLKIGHLFFLMIAATQIIGMIIIPIVNARNRSGEVNLNFFIGLELLLVSLFAIFISIAADLEQMQIKKMRRKFQSKNFYFLLSLLLLLSLFVIHNG